MSEWHETLNGVLDRAWQMLVRGVNDPRHAARTPTLATMSKEGPEQRTLVLRQANRAAGTLTLFTDAATSKVRQLRDDPRASLHIWDKRSQIQLRIAAHVSMTPGEREIWDQMPEGAREVYGVEPAPGTRISDPEGFHRNSNADKFLKLTLQIVKIELVTLGLPIHRRAEFKASDNWRGHWLAP
ncbi:MAG: pyridoxamine 5'-phosphate oxidase family protein [Pseudomonadota bacterium]